MKNPLAPLSRLDWRARRRIGRLVAAGIDLLQITVFPLFLPGITSPLNDVVDVVAAIFMTALFGWNIAFLPTFVTEMVPFVTLFPTWTVAVLWVTRKAPPSTSQPQGTQPM